jgi:hypothetical protein
MMLAAFIVALPACGGGKGDDKAAEQVEQAFENKADALDRAADNASGATEERLEDEAEIYRRTGEAAAEAIDDVDLNTEATVPANAQ